MFALDFVSTQDHSDLEKSKRGSATSVLVCSYANSPQSASSSQGNDA